VISGSLLPGLSWPAQCERAGPDRLNVATRRCLPASPVTPGDGRCSRDPAPTRSAPSSTSSASTWPTPPRPRLAAPLVGPTHTMPAIILTAVCPAIAFAPQTSLVTHSGPSEPHGNDMDATFMSPGQHECGIHVVCDLGALGRLRRRPVEAKDFTDPR